MTSQQTHYEVLGCLNTATYSEIKAAYQRAALSLHPDKQLAQQQGAAEALSQGGGATGHQCGPGGDLNFERVQQAWQVR